MSFGGLFDIMGGGGGGGGGSFSGGGIGSSQSAQESTSTTTTNDQSKVDNRDLGGSSFAGGDMSLVTGDTAQIDITTIDPGALATARAIVSDSMGHLQDSLNSVQSLASDSIQQAYSLAQDARKSETAGAIDQFVSYVFWLGLAGIVAYVAINGKKG
jgi:hypothetical protein